MALWRNDDGLDIRFGTDRARDTDRIGWTVNAVGPYNYMVVDIDYDNLPTFTADSNNDGTDDAFSLGDPYIPAGSYITKATWIVETAYASGTSYNVGLYDIDGSAIDADGIDAAVAAAALAANQAVDCDGQLVATQDLVTSDAYLVVAATGTFTTGKGKLVIEYIQVAP